MGPPAGNTEAGYSHGLGGGHGSPPRALEDPAPPTPWF